MKAGGKPSRKEDVMTVVASGLYQSEGDLSVWSHSINEKPHFLQDYTAQLVSPLPSSLAQVLEE